MMVQCTKGHLAAGLVEGAIYDVALELPAGTTYKLAGREYTCKEVGYVLNNSLFPYVWDSSRFVVV